MKIIVTLLTLGLLAFTPPKKEPVSKAMASAVRNFLNSLDTEQRKQATYPFDSDERFNWHFVPRERKGLPLKQMNDKQRQAAMTLLKTALSEQGYTKATAIIDMENVLRIVENRPANDTYRDPENYSFTVFGEPSEKEPWGWRIEGHHLSLHFSSLTNKIIDMTPAFMGSNPGEVRIEGPKKGKQILKQETALGYALLNALNEDQRKKAVISETCPNDIVTSNKRKASLDKQEGLAYSDMTGSQQKIFMELLNTYLGNYQITLANQQMDRLKESGLDKLMFAWMGDREPGFGPGKGQYYRIHGPTLLIEYDNSQNQANHIHTVVRDLTKDFGEDLLTEHYKNQHGK
ncbi:DUF3500 domain-containing protein [Nibrella viscosa]|uniref:DUF3500 domain-containing protein n=1 Tax=Nibrella viscosa TaxID=1084524 RepID=A0ABP8L3N9_9BACT